MDDANARTVAEIRRLASVAQFGAITRTIEAALALCEPERQVLLRTYFIKRTATAILNSYLIPRRRVEITRFEEANPQWADSLARAVLTPHLASVVEAMVAKYEAQRPT